MRAISAARSYEFTISVEDAFVRAHALAAGGGIGVTAGDMGGQALALGLIDHVAIDIAPVVVGRGKPYFGSVRTGCWRIPTSVIQGQRVLHLRYPVRGS